MDVANDRSMREGTMPEDLIQNQTRTLLIPANGVRLTGELTIPSEATGLVVFAHGSGSSRLSPRNRQVAAALQESSLATLLFDLLTPDEEAIDAVTRRLRFSLADFYHWCMRRRS